ncbi:MAG: glycerol kinase GlpK [Candidatus Latescibacteria bacterium]|nr:glycerol kinase GlpK [Candidatus Latescibacterota bacterium]
MTNDDVILAIDQGTTGTTVLVFDRESSIRGRAYSEFTQHYPHPGRVEHDAVELWDVAIGVVGAALENAGIGPECVHAIGITNQRETTVMWDRADSVPVSRALVWQDRRTAALCDELESEGLEPTWREKTGLLIDPYFSATKVFWLFDNVPGLRRRAEKGEIAFGTIDSWLVWKLTGGARHVTDYSNASRTLLYNIHDLEWDADILRRLDIPEAILPDVLPSSRVYGETDPDVFFGHRVPIAGIAGDQQAALFGQACYGEGLAKNTYGTGSFLLMNTGVTPPRNTDRMLATIAWGIGDEPVEYALEGAIFVTGAAVQWLRDGLGIIADAAETETLAASVDGNDGVYFVPALTGLGAPHWDPYARGMIVGLTRGTGREHIVRAALESICYQTRDAVEAMERESGVRLKELRADGGATANRFLMQFQADMLGVPVEVPLVPETTALGAASLAGLATGFWESREELDDRWKAAARYEPRMAPSERDRLYARWKEAVARSLGWAEEGEE